MTTRSSLRPTAMDVMQRLEARGFNVREVSTDRGTLRMWQHSKDVFGSRACGRLEMAHAELFVRYTSERVIACPQWSVHDWLALDNYDTEARIALTQLGLDYYEHYKAIVVGTASRIVTMGVTVANVALRLKVKSVPTREALLRETRVLLEQAEHADPRRVGGL